jgi:NAD(P)-dependent dehydrogenase (short-subunit alcohol dehydrogenase family)
MKNPATSKFGESSTTDEVLAGVDLRGMRALVTGVSSGIGVETTRALVAKGAHVVGTARDLAKGASATGHVRAAAAAGGGQLELIQLDLALLESVRAAVDRLMMDAGKFDVVIANAGVMATPFGRTVDGFETQFATNHLGHFLMVNQLGSLLTDNARVVIVSSSGHRTADIDLSDLNFERTQYDRWVAYGRSKTANVLFAVEFDRRHRERGVRACAVMPGLSLTGLAQYLTQQDLEASVVAITEERAAAGLPPPRFKTLAQVAATQVWAAVVAKSEEVGGRYCEDCRVAPVDDTPGFRDGVRRYALDPERAKLLWKKSEELVGENF